MADAKIVITGTGRAGTTLLVRILDALGLDTGIDSGKLAPYMPGVRAGLESRVDDATSPTVVKDMTLGFRMREVLEQGNVNIEHVIIPTRRLDIAAASRIRAADYGKLPFKRGALTGTLYTSEQEKVLVRLQEEIVSSLTDHGVPYTFLEFPRFATDAAYIHSQLGFLVPDASLETFQGALARCVRPELIHEAPLSKRERLRTWVTEIWMRVVRFPLARFRQWRDPEGSAARLRESVAKARREDALAAEREANP